MYLLDELTRLVKREANIRQVDPKIIQTLVTMESSWRPMSARYERFFPWLSEPELHAKHHGITKATEVTFQKTSWGLLHIMGGTARDCGFSGWLPDLCSPDVGIRWGIEYFVNVCAGYEDIKDQFAAYNGGRGAVKHKPDGSFRNQEHQDYVDKAMKIYGKL